MYIILTDCLFNILPSLYLQQTQTLADGTTYFAAGIRNATQDDFMQVQVAQLPSNYPAEPTTVTCSWTTS